MTQPFGKPSFDAGLGTVGGRYVLDGRLGEGGMGQVYRARHVQLGKPFALKIISPAFADDTAARVRFNQEAKLASEISHPNIVSVVDYGEDTSFGAYMVMELVDGEPLLGGEHAEPMTVRRTCEILGQIADALHHVHQHGIVHGDVKAENIMLVTEHTNARRRRNARLLDFGLARRRGDDGEQQLSGSPHYMAPERCTGMPASVASDVYALGVLGYLLFTGTLPFDGTVIEVLMAHVNNEAQPLTARRSCLDPALEALIARAMAKDPAQRHASAAAFRYELNTVMHMLGMQKRSSRPSSPMRAADPREATITAAFEHSKLPQALTSADGEIAYASLAFAKLVGREVCDGVDLADTSLAAWVPDLLKRVRTVNVTGRPTECRTLVPRENKAALELVIWLTPLAIPGSEVHLIVHVAEVAAPCTPLVRRG